MKQTRRNPLLAAAACAGLSLPVLAADHAESPTVTADPAADIADVFLFRPVQTANVLVAAMTFAGRPSTAAGGTRIDGPVMRCDRNVLYVFNFDNNAPVAGGGNDPLDATADIRVLARLARNGNGQCGVQLENVPGAGGRLISGREGQILTDTGSTLKAYAGLVEDPFFFDTMGFGTLLASLGAAGQSGDLSGFNNTRDTFGGRNLSAIVFEMDLNAVAGGDAATNPKLQFWGDTLRFPGTQP